MKKLKAYLLLFFCLISSFGCLVPTSKFIEKPKGINKTTQSLQSIHSNFTSNCAECHEKDRLPAVAGVLHGDGKDCAQCHVYSGNRKWAAHDKFTHIPTPGSCLGCHGDERPPSPHPVQGDCLTCHAFPDWNELTQFDHSTNPQSCNSCHEADRKLTDNHPPSGAGDCISCHNYSDSIGWKDRTGKEPYSHSPKPASCNACHSFRRPLLPHKQGGDCILCHDPGTEIADWKNKSKFFAHDPMPTSCAQCHDDRRPAAPHPSTGECTTCHKPANFTEAIGWKNVPSFSHSPTPSSCNTCHASSRPIAPHPQTGDCKECHIFNRVSKWKNVSQFSHDPLPNSCTSCHANDRPTAPHPVAGECKTCHTSFDRVKKWKNVASFSHNPVPATCISCHSEDRPASGFKSYPGSIGGFPNPPGYDPTGYGTGHYKGIDCKSCHHSPGNGQNNWVFDTATHANPVMQQCLPCHYNRGYAKHANTVDYTEGGNCYNCHKGGRSWDFRP